MKTSIAFLLVFVGASNTNAQFGAVFPLHPGDRWHIYQWHNEANMARKVVRDTVMPNGKSYAVVVDSGSSNRTRYQRQSGGNVFQYGLITPNQEQLLFDFSRSVGDTISRIPHGTDTAFIVLYSRVFGTVFGKQRWQWGFKFDYSRYVWDDEAYYTVADSLGITRTEGFGWEDETRGAIINGIMYGTLTEIDGPTSETTMQYVVLQNYPNPFNPTTKIIFLLLQRSHVKLLVCDLLGREVMVLVDGIRDAGRHEQLFNGTNLASGVYVCRLISTGQVQTLKLILQK